MLSWELRCRHISAIATHTPDSDSQSPTDFDVGTTKKYHPATVHQQEFTPSPPQFHFIASTRCFTPESPLLLTKHTSIQAIKWLQKLSSGGSGRNSCHLPKQVRETDGSNRLYPIFLV